MYIPLITTDDGSVIDFTNHINYHSGLGNIELIETKYGKAYNISSKGIVEIKIDEPKLKNKPGALITLENNTEYEDFGNRWVELWIFFN